MKTKILMMAALVITTMTFAQKKEVKALEKAVKSGSFGEAKNLLVAAESLSSAMDTKTKTKFLLLKGQAYLGVGNQNIDELKKAAEAFSQLEGTNYATEAETGLANTVAAIVNSAVDDQNSNKFAEAGAKLSEAYKYSGDNKDYLFYAASNFLNAKKYGKASMIFQGLLDDGYEGQQENFYAINKESGEKTSFNTKQERDFAILSKDYINPTKELSESRKETIENYLIAIYTQEGESDKALDLIESGLTNNPDNAELLLSKANLFFKMKKMDKYKETISKVLVLDPNNPELTYNIGVSEDQLGNQEKAREYYEKTIQLDPEHAQAYNNIAALILSKDKSLMDEMNSLGTSNADYDRYDTLKGKRKALYKEAKPYLQKALAVKPDYLGVAQTLYSIHQQLGENSEADAVKAKIDAIESAN